MDIIYCMRHIAYATCTINMILKNTINYMVHVLYSTAYRHNQDGDLSDKYSTTDTINIIYCEYCMPRCSHYTLSSKDRATIDRTTTICIMMTIHKAYDVPRQ